MGTICNIIDNISNREWSIFFWTSIFILISLRSKKIRQSILNILRLLFHWKILLTFTSTIICVVIGGIILHRYNLWDESSLKNIIWYSAWAIITTCQVTQNKFKNFWDILKPFCLVTTVIAAILEINQFNVFVEIIITGFTIFIAIMQYSTQEERMKKFCKGILVILSTIIIVKSGYELFSNFRIIFSKNLILTLTTPIFLTVFLALYYYLLSLITTYEQMLCTLKCMSCGDNREYKFRRNTLFYTCKLNLKKLMLVKENWRPALCNTDEEYLRELDAVSHNKRISYYGE